MTLLWILVAVIIFSIVVLVHEIGHFSTARFFGVKVEEFGFGIPPRAKTLFKDKKWTIYSLNWLPLWGFVKMTGENINTFQVYDKNKKLYHNSRLEKDIKDWKDIFDIAWNKLLKIEKEEILIKLEENKAPYNLTRKPAWQQAIIMLAWVFMNFLLAFLIFFVLFLVWVRPIWINDKIPTSLELKLIPTYQDAINSGLLVAHSGLILSPMEGSIAENSGLMVGDILLEVRDETWEVFAINTANDLVEILWINSGKNIDFLVNNWNIINVKIPENWKIWTYLAPNIEVNADFKYKYWLLDSAKYAFIETKNEILLTFKWIWYILKRIFNPQNPEERHEAIQSVSWPIGIVDFITNSLSAWIIFLAIFWAIISISLWVFNLLPIPALDWWRFLFILINSTIEKVFGKKFINGTTEGILHFVFFIILIALSLIIWYNDITRIINN